MCKRHFHRIEFPIFVLKTNSNRCLGVHPGPSYRADHHRIRVDVPKSPLRASPSFDFSSPPPEHLLSICTMSSTTMVSACRKSITQLLSRTRTYATSTQPRMGSSSGESFWSAGKHEPGGLLFAESPPAPGTSRSWESWEGPWYFAFGAATAILTVGLSAKPDTNLTSWAEVEARKRRAGGQ